jgi:hypothetical protein
MSDALYFLTLIPIINTRRASRYGRESVLEPDISCSVLPFLFRLTFSFATSQVELNSSPELPGSSRLEPDNQI